jgi:hypothetical protein
MPNNKLLKKKTTRKQKPRKGIEKDFDLFKFKDQMTKEMSRFKNKISTSSHHISSNTDYDKKYKQYISEGFTMSTLMLINRMFSDSKTLPKDLRTNYPLHSLLTKIIRQLMMNELELVYFSIYLDTFGWKNNNVDIMEHFLMTGLSVKKFLNVNTEYLENFLNSEYPSLLDKFNHWLKTEKDYNNLITISPRDVNERFRLLKRPYNAYCKNNFIDYNESVDRILHMSLPYNESTKQNNEIKMFHSLDEFEPKSKTLEKLQLIACNDNYIGNNVSNCNGVANANGSSNNNNNKKKSVSFKVERSLSNSNINKNKINSNNNNNDNSSCINNNVNVNQQQPIHQMHMNFNMKLNKNNCSFSMINQNTNTSSSTNNNNTFQSSLKNTITPPTQTQNIFTQPSTSNLHLNLGQHSILSAMNVQFNPVINYTFPSANPYALSNGNELLKQQSELAFVDNSIILGRTPSGFEQANLIARASGQFMDNQDDALQDCFFKQNIELKKNMSMTSLVGNDYNKTEANVNNIFGLGLNKMFSNDSNCGNNNIIGIKAIKNNRIVYKDEDIEDNLNEIRNHNANMNVMGNANNGTFNLLNVNVGGFGMNNVNVSSSQTQRKNLLNVYHEMTNVN